ncbi:MAG: LamG-like jellyroll fold domain-containing protein, partial [Opitutales bacterium]
GSQGTFDGGTVFSISTWVKEWPDGGWEPYVSKRGEGNGWQLRRRGGDADRISFTMRGPGNDDWFFQKNINDDKWHHLVATFGGGKRKGYVDGVKIAEENRGGTVSPTGSQLVLGARDNSNNAGNGVSIGNHSNIWLDDVRFYRGVLSEAEVKTIFDGDLYRPRPAPVFTAPVATGGSPTPVSVTFKLDDKNTDVTGFELSDITATNGTLSDLAGSGHTYTFKVTPTSDPTTVTVTIANNAATSGDMKTGGGSTSIDYYKAASLLSLKPVVWYDASHPGAITATNNNVTTWKDKSGNEHTATRSSGNMMLKDYGSNGLKFVEFRSNPLAVISGDMYAKQQYIVFSLPQIGGDWGSVLGNNASRAGYMFHPNGYMWNGNYPAGVRQNGGAELGPNYQLSNPKNFMVVKITGNDNNSSVRGGWRLGRTEGWNGLQMNLAEIISFATVLPADQEDLVTGYLAHKYDLKGNLPASHPYKDFSPLDFVPDISAPAGTGASPIPVSITFKSSGVGVDVDIEKLTLGNEAIDSSDSGNNAGDLIYDRLSAKVTKAGRLTSWSFFDNDDFTPDRVVTPMIIREAGPTGRQIIGIGKTRTTTEDGLQTYAFDLQDGTDEVLADGTYFFGFRHGTADGKTINFGVVDAKWSGSTSYYFTHGSTPSPVGDVPAG